MIRAEISNRQKMLTGNISPLQDNRFGGPNIGLCNSQEVPYGYYSADTDRMSAVSEVANVNSGQSKPDEMFHCSKSEEFFLKNQPYSQSPCPKDADTSFGMSDRNFLSESSSVGIGFVERDPQIIAAKRMKLTVDHPLFEDSVVSSMQLENLISGTYQPVLAPVCPGLVFNVVESSGEGMISSHYVSKQGVDADKEANFRGRDIPKANLSGSDRSKGNTVDVHEAIASPDSQESFATKSLAAGPSSVLASQCGSLVSAGKRPKRAPACSPPVKFEEDTLLRGNGTKDPRVVLRHRTFCLLKEAGWSIDKIKRNCRAYDEFIYTTPEGKLVREFTKAWELCGRSLLDHGISQYIEEKQWNDLRKFWSDLFDTVKTVDNEMKDWEPAAALPLKWALLDPFVVVVFIDRRIITLKNGNPVKVQCSVAGKDSKSVTVSTSGSVGNKGDRACERPALTAHYDASLLSESSMLDFDGHSEGVAAQIPVMRSVYSSEGNTMACMETPYESGKLNEQIFAAEISKGSLTVPSSCMSHLACLQSTGCLYEDPLGFGNFDMIDRHSETFSSHQGSCSLSSASCSKQNLELSMEAKKDVGAHLFEDGDKPLERRLINEGMQLSSLTDDNQNCVNKEFLKSSGLDKVSWASSKNVNSVFPSWKEIKESLVDNSQCMGKKSGDLASVVDERQEMSPVASISDVDRNFKGVAGKHTQCFDSPNLEKNATFSSGSFDSKKKMHKKLKKISDIDCTTSSLAKSSEMEEGLGVNAQVGESCYKLSNSGSKRKSGKNKLKRRKSDSEGSFGSDCSKEVPLGKTSFEAVIGSSSKKKSRKSCKLKDDDLLITAIMQKKIFASGRNCRGPKGSKAKAPKRGTSQKGSCRLLPYGLSKGGNHMTHSRWSSLSKRTVLSWLVNVGEISVNEVIQFRDPRGDNVVKVGVVATDGIVCKCCSELLSLSRFKVHASFEPSSPYSNLFMESGKPFTLCQIQAWSIEYETKKNGAPTVQDDESDHNDDSCGWCGDGGELLCCDNCPATYHQACILSEELPEGSWYCPSCSCRSCGNLVDEIEACGNLVDEKEASSSSAAFKCSQCEHKYHGACLRGKGLSRIGSSLWFCCGGCEEVYSGLHSRIGISYNLDDGFSWSVLRCIHDDQKIHSAQWFALKAECNSKLAVALSIMEECFVSMVDPRTGINMIPHAIFNLGSTFSRLNYHGFYSVVLEKDDVLVAVASIRVHGTKLAEVPLVATCSKYRRQGMCRRLLSSIEKMLISFKVEMLVMAAIPSLVETWTVGFGFVPMEEDEKRSLNKTTLMVFPETVMLKKTLYVNKDADSSQNDATGSPVKKDESAELETGRGQVPITESMRARQAIEVCVDSKVESMNHLVQEEAEGDKTIVGANDTESNLCVPGSPADKGEDDGETDSKLENDLECSSMEIDFDQKINEARENLNVQPEDMPIESSDAQAIESSDAQAIESNDMAALHIASDGLVSERNLQCKMDIVGKHEPKSSSDKAMCSPPDENGNQGDGSVAEPCTTSAAEDGKDDVTNPCSEQCVEVPNADHPLDSKTSTAPLDPEIDEEQAILEAFAAVKAAFNNYVELIPI